MLWTTLFNAILTTHYIVPNFATISNIFPWLSYFTSALSSPLFASSSTTTWITEYRLTSPNFFIVKAVLQPLGLVIALGGLVALCRRMNRVVREEEKVGCMGALEGCEAPPQVRLEVGVGRGMQSIDLRD